MKKQTKKIEIGYAQFTFESDVDGRELMDTNVSVNNSFLISISGSEIDKFIEEMKALVDRYRI